MSCTATAPSLLQTGHVHRCDGPAFHGERHICGCGAEFLAIFQNTDHLVGAINTALHADVNPGDIAEHLSYRQRQYLAMIIDSYDYLHKP